MKSLRKKTTTKKKFLVTVGILLIAAIALTIYFLWPKNQSENTSNSDTSTTQDQETNTTPPTQEQIDAGNNAKKETVENSDPTTPPDTTASLPVTITAANQNDSTFNIRVLIDELINSGTCTLKLTQGSSTVTKTASVQALPEAATCQGFDIPVSELASGSWQLTITVTASNRSGSATQEITIN